jgi:hypothetical protein
MANNRVREAVEIHGELRRTTFGGGLATAGGRITPAACPAQSLLYL